MTSLLQSSTATALVAASFAGAAITTAMGVALMLGADVGSTLIIQILSFDMVWLSPTMIVVGVLLFMNSQNSTKRALARAAIGLGLILLSLAIISRRAFAGNRGFLCCSPFTHRRDDSGGSDLGGRDMVYSFQRGHRSSCDVSRRCPGSQHSTRLRFMVLGANLGSAITAFAATSRSTPAARRVPLGI